MALTNKWKCAYHLTPPTGWMNDPNGICQLGKTYHVFFQYAPDYPKDDNKSWGHYISNDLLHWRFIGTALYPDNRLDKDGAYSGNALIEDGTMTIYYTGNVMQDGDHDYTHSGRESNTIRVTSKDGIHFSPKECVLNNQDYPANYTCHIRDPKVWKDNNIYKMVLGGRKNDDSGAILIYESMDGIHWSHAHDVTSHNPFGYMWECPDIFELEHRYYLSCCPQGIKPEPYRYQNHHLSGYFPLSATDIQTSGTEQPELATIDETRFQEWDYGFDFYAPQTFLDDQGRRILIGWVGGPDNLYAEPSLEQEHWIYNLTVPRVIEMRNGTLTQMPISELKQLRSTVRQLQCGVSEELPSNCFDWELSANTPLTSFQIQFTDDMELIYKDSILSLRFSGETGAGRICRRLKCEAIQSLRILSDRSVIEIYINGGTYVMTSRFFPKKNLNVCVQGAFTQNQLWVL